MSNLKDTFKYLYKIGNLVVHCGITDDLSRSEQEHKNSGRYTLYKGKRYYWKNGHISQQGRIMTREAAMEWERLKRCNEDWGNI